jgi:hypothetical protein
MRGKELNSRKSVLHQALFLRYYGRICNDGEQFLIPSINGALETLQSGIKRYLVNGKLEHCPSAWLAATQGQELYMKLRLPKQYPIKEILVENTVTTLRQCAMGLVPSRGKSRILASGDVNRGNIFPSSLANSVGNLISVSKLKARLSSIGMI